MRRILNIAYYEFLHILHAPVLLMMVIIVPGFYTVLFAGVYWQPYILQVPTAVVDWDQTEDSHRLIESYRNAEGFDLVLETTDYEQVKYAMNDGYIRAAVIIPEHLSADIQQHHRPEVLTVVDASNLIYAFNIRKNNRQVINNYMQDYTVRNLAGMGMLPADIVTLQSPLDSNIELYYNPDSNYVNFIFMGLLMMIIHQIGMLSVSLTIPREKEQNTWIQYLASPVPSWAIVTGKMLPYFISNFFNLTFILWLASMLLQLKMEGHVGLVIFLLLLYDLIITSIGFILAKISPNSLQITRYLMLLSVPLFMISGYTWPATHMHGSMQALGRLMPFTWMAHAMRTAALKQPEWADMTLTLAVMGGMALLSLAGALYLKKYRSLRPDEEKLAVNGGLGYPTRRHKKFVVDW